MINQFFVGQWWFTSEFGLVSPPKITRFHGIILALRMLRARSVKMMETQRRPSCLPTPRRRSWRQHHWNDGAWWGSIPAGRMMFQLFLQIRELEINLLEFGQKWLMIPWNLLTDPRSFDMNQFLANIRTFPGGGRFPGGVASWPPFFLFLSTTAWLILAGVLSYWDVPTHLFLDLLKSWNYQPW